MPDFPPDSPSSDLHADAVSSTEGSDVEPGEEVRRMESSGGSSESLFPSTSSPPELNDEETQQTQTQDGSWSQHGDLQGCGQLERRWVLWHEFMKEHAHLNRWLRMAEQAVGSPSSAHITYITAKDELRKFERLLCEARSRSVQLDSLTRRNRTLTRLFRGAMRARLLASARKCSHRWDDVNAKLESITGRLKHFLSEWEGFEAEREELDLLLAELDVRLNEVDHVTGNTCDKLRQLQSFRQSVCVNSGRVNALLQRGEALIQRSQPTDAHHVESRLLDLLRHCTLVYNNIARTHTRLLSMRLVFEEDWVLSQATDSGCPSESVLEEEGTNPKPPKKDSACPKASSSSSSSSSSSDPSSPVRHPPPPHPSDPPSSSSPTHEHSGLEWDPSVDIGRSVSCDDADSSYFSASAGVCHRDGVKRRSFLSSLGSLSDISDDKQEAGLRLDGWSGHAHPNVLSSEETQGGGTPLNEDQLVTSTPGREDKEPVSFDGGRVRAWLGFQSPAPPERRTSCSKAVQTDGQVKCLLTDAPNSQHHHDNAQQPHPALSSSLSHDPKASSDWIKQQYRSDLQAEEEQICVEEAEHLRSEQSGRVSSFLPSPALLCLLLAMVLALLAGLIWVALEQPCHRSSWMPGGFHLTLRYVNGPPPT